MKTETGARRRETGGSRRKVFHGPNQTIRKGAIPSNIAEGYERGSNREFVQFLNYSRGSSGELRTQIYLATKLAHFESANGRELIERSRKVSAMLAKYVQVRKRDF